MMAFIILMIVGTVLIGWLIGRWFDFFQFEKKENTKKEDVPPKKQDEQQKLIEQNILLQAEVSVLTCQKKMLQNQNDFLTRENSQLATKVNEQEQMERVRKFEDVVKTLHTCR